MKRSMLAVTATLMLASVSAHAQTSGLPRPSFNDAPDATPIRITGTQTFAHNFPKGTMDSGGPKGPATVVLEGYQPAFTQQAAAETGTLSDAVPHAARPFATLNDLFHYPY